MLFFVSCVHDQKQQQRKLFFSSMFWIKELLEHSERSTRQKRRNPVRRGSNSKKHVRRTNRKHTRRHAETSGRHFSVTVVTNQMFLSGFAKFPQRRRLADSSLHNMLRSLGHRRLRLMFPVTERRCVLARDRRGEFRRIASEFHDFVGHECK